MWPFTSPFWSLRHCSSSSVSQGQGSQLLVRFLTFAVIETILVMLFFMNLGTENSGFIKFFVYFMLFVLATMNYVWTDSFRLLLFRLTGYTPS